MFYLYTYSTGPAEFDEENSKIKGLTNLPPPQNITMRKGSKQVVLSKDMVDFIIDHSFAWALYDWLRSTRVPDEHFYATLATISANGDKVTQQVDC